MPFLIILFILLFPFAGACQSESGPHSSALLLTTPVNQNLLNSVEDKYKGIEKKLTHFTENSLAKLKKQQLRLQKKLSAKDSLGSKDFFSNTESKYAALIQKVNSPVSNLSKFKLNEYVPILDSLQTTFRFLEKSSSGITGFPSEKLSQMKGVFSQINIINNQLQHAYDVKLFVAQQQQLLKEQLEKYGMQTQLKQFSKQAYYYQQQLTEYKSLISDPSKAEEKALSLVRETPAFKDFMAKNSLLASLFPVSSGGSTSGEIPGLQTRTGIEHQLDQTSLGGSGDPKQYIQQQVMAAQSQLDALKDKVNKAGGGSGDMVMPDFKANNQKTKSFWKRIEYGLNIQSQKTNGYLPVTTDIALTMGYKLSDKSTIGVGAGYKVGWGKNISNIKLTSQGASIRSYVDFKLKGNIWISGGYERNYLQEFTRIDQLKEMSVWQSSALIGLTKKYKIGKKNGNLQLLWDFMSYSQVPKAIPLKFRLGYVF